MKENLEQRLSHARYEYDMARYCIYELQEPQTQAQWNVLLAAFAVYFRNTRIFLTGDGDQESIKAKNYIRRFSPSSAKELEPELNELHSQVLHLSGKRTSKDDEKLGLAEAIKLMKWLEANVQQFVNELESPYRGLWPELGPKGPANAEIKEYRGWTGPAGPSATNHITDTTQK